MNVLFEGNNLHLRYKNITADDPPIHGWPAFSCKKRGFEKVYDNVQLLDIGSCNSKGIYLFERKEFNWMRVGISNIRASGVG